MFRLRSLRGGLQRRPARPRPLYPRRSPRARPLVIEALEARTLLSYSFTLIADNGPQSPYSVVNNAPINDQGMVPFRADLRSGGAGIFTRGMDGSLGIIAITSDLVRTFPFGLSISDGGTVSFGADLRDGVRAIFTGSGQELTRLVDTGPDSPFSDLLPPAATINNASTVAFRATLMSGGAGLFTVRPGEQPRILYVTGGRFASFLSAAVLERHGETVTFRATLSAGADGIFTGSGGATTTIATIGDTFSALSNQSINDAGTVAFRATLSAGGQAVLKADGGPLTVIADTSGPFSSFFGNATSINNAGTVAFAANLKDAASGIFTGPDPVADKVIATGDPIFGSTVASIDATPFPPRGLNDAGQLTFLVHLADGRTVLVRADPVGELNPCTVSLAPSGPSPPPVGERVTWTATASNCGEAPVYQFSVGPVGGPLHVVRDFSPASSFVWTPMQEGGYYVQVTVKDEFGTTADHSAAVMDRVNSRVNGLQAIVTPTANPLVALYSVPPSPEGTVHVEFSVAGDNASWRSTNVLPSIPGKSTNFLVAGMLPNTKYQIRHVQGDGTTSSPLFFTTGAIRPSVQLPSFTVIQPPGPGSDLDQDLLFQQLGRPPQNVPYPFVSDLTGQVVWYYDLSQAGLLLNPATGSSLVPGGTVLLMGADSNTALPLSRNVLREIDLAGNTLRETNIAAVNAQLTALGHDIIYSLTHDVQRLPNGATAVIGLAERTVNINGTQTNYVGTMIVVLNQDFQVTWAWDAFDYLDVSRGPVLGEILQPGSPEPTSAVPILPAVDWLHCNAVSWSPADGNLVLSMRHQDWVIKIDYRNGGGDGHIVWRLGQDGDFTVNSTDPNPWFSHQHNAHYIDDSTLILFDNGNTRRASDPNADSRGQVWTLDETTMTATLVFNVDLGNYSPALGAAQLLSNGNYVFTSGWIAPIAGAGPVVGRSIEVRPDGTKAYVLQINTRAYRSYRVRTLYEGANELRGGGGGGAPSRAMPYESSHDHSSAAVESFRGDGFSPSLFSMPATSTAKLSTETQEPTAGILLRPRPIGDEATAASLLWAPARTETMAALDSLFADSNSSLASEALKPFVSILVLF
jgi:arylsulfate sulfotransferase